MRLMMLGASGAQLQGIRMAKALGHQVVTCDYLPHAIGHREADDTAYASTFDVAGVLEIAKELHIDGIMTMGTDQPVYTAARVSEALGLPSLLRVETALAVTHKAVMKERLVKAGIAVVDYVVYQKGTPDSALKDLNYPVVVKPVDSQGQRGVFFLESPEAVLAHVDAVLAYSRDTAIMVESYYPHEEVTLSGWVENGRAYAAAVTDRISFPDKERLGICLSHEYPSKHLTAHGPVLLDLTQQIVSCMGIENGPIYFQYFIGDAGIRVNEIACRIGGAYEAEYLPVMTGVDLCRMQIEAALGLPVDGSALRRVTPLAPEGVLSVQLFFAEPGVVHGLPELSQILSAEGVMAAGLNIQQGDTLKPITDATARAGYAIVKADNRQQLEERLCGLYSILQIHDEAGRNCILHRPVAQCDGRPQ